MWRVAWLSIFAAAAWAAAEPKQPAGKTPEGAQEGVIDPKADQALKRMSDYLGNLKSFQVESDTVDEKYTRDGQKIQELQQSTITVRRPGELRVDRVSPRGHAVFRADGKQFAVYNKDKNVYATAPAPEHIDQAVDEVRDKLNIDAPGGDLIVSDPYRDLTDGTITGRYIGLEPIDGAMAHHLAFTKKDVDWQIWIKDGPEPVPVRYVITSKDSPTQPQFTMVLHDWQPNVQVMKEYFAFTPPAGAKRLEFKH
jgi:hypothetical protein